MITLYAEPDCSDCRRLREKLEEHHLSHQVEQIPAGSSGGHTPHTLDDNGELIEGHRAIGRRIDELWGFLQRTRRYQSDVCMDFGDDADPDLRER